MYVWHLSCKARDAANKHPTVCRTDVTIESDLAPNVSGAKVEKLWARSY